MAKMMFWVGYFPTEEDFEKYMDQTEFYQWWSKYDEDNSELRCQFCKELGISSYDEDFSIMKYLKESDKIQDCIDFIPANNELLRPAFEKLSLKKANAVICYTKGHEIKDNVVDKATSVSYLGVFDYSTKEIMSRFSTSGMRFSTFLGITNKSEAEFMEYFNQETYLEELRRYESGETKKRPNPDLRCQFCKDVGITHYHPEFLKIKFTKEPSDPLYMVREVVTEKCFSDFLLLSAIKKKNIKSANCAFCYVANGFRDKKLDQHINIYKKNSPMLIKRKKNDLDELDSYNGLSFLGSFAWE